MDSIEINETKRRKRYGKPYRFFLKQKQASTRIQFRRTKTMQITGAELFLKALRYEQADLLFAYPGGQVIDLFNVLYDAPDIKVILPRHEQGLIHAADGYARSTRRTGVCLVTSGPGAANLVTGIATANYDSVPLVCFTGQVPTKMIGNHSFQEADIHADEIPAALTMAKTCENVL